MLEAYAKRDDAEVDRILAAVEKATTFRMPSKDRCAIWKALRFDWFRSPEFARPFIDRSEVPPISIPKHHHRQKDHFLDLSLLDSERQRMVRRRTVLDEVEGTIVSQEEVYKRQSHLHYELAGLESTQQYWMAQDPRKMAREDPREEVLLNQTKSLELIIASRIERLKKDRRERKIITNFFLVVKIILCLAAVALFVCSIVHQSGSAPRWVQFSSSPLLRSSCVYFFAFWFVSETTKSRRNTRDLDVAHQMHTKCRLLHSDMISFRLKTHHLRQDKIPRYLDEAQLGVSAAVADNNEDEDDGQLGKPREFRNRKAFGKTTEMIQQSAVTLFGDLPLHPKSRSMLFNDPVPEVATMPKPISHRPAAKIDDSIPLWAMRGPEVEEFTHEESLEPGTSRGDDSDHASSQNLVAIEDQGEVTGEDFQEQEGIDLVNLQKDIA